MTSEIILRPKPLLLSQVPLLAELGHLEGDAFVFEKGLKGCKLKTHVSVPIKAILDLGHPGLIEYAVRAMIRERPLLLLYTFQNQTLIELGRYFLQYRSQSLQSYYAYVDDIKRFCDWLGHSVDQVITDANEGDGLPNLHRIQKHTRFLEDYLSICQDKKLSPGRI